MVPLFSKSNDALTFRLGEIAHRDVECVYYIPSLFNMVEQSERNNILYFKLKDSSEEYFFDAEGYIFTSLNDLLEYNFGSIDNYITTYQKRMKNKSMQMEILKDFFKNRPRTKGKVRIRGTC